MKKDWIGVSEITGNYIQMPKKDNPEIRIPCRSDLLETEVPVLALVPLGGSLLHLGSGFWRRDNHLVARLPVGGCRYLVFVRGLERFYQPEISGMNRPFCRG